MPTVPIPNLQEPYRSRFLSRIASPDSNGCCLWTRYTMPNGYGVFHMGKRVVLVHRLAYTLFVGPIPDGLDLDHLCHVRRCCTPDHLRAVTRKQNMEHLVAAHSDSKSGVLGVTPRTTKSGTRWIAQAMHNGKQHYLGMYATIEEAEAAAIAGRLARFTHNDIDRQGTAL